ncbi:hypothetical protein KSD_84900 [Ktedonobacter sp. SOSP1-85]|nr:hypothetical protein KSD_84900 [Ktedonobacter sp. SOSP1-85]
MAGRGHPGQPRMLNIFYFSTKASSFFFEFMTVSWWSMGPMGFYWVRREMKRD